MQGDCEWCPALPLHLYAHIPLAAIAEDRSKPLSPVLLHWRRGARCRPWRRSWRAILTMMSEKADVWPLGMVLGDMLALRTPLQHLSIRSRSSPVYF